MPLIHLLVILLVIGFVLFLINRYAPIDAKIKTVINWVVMAAVVIYLIGVFFPEACSGFHDIRVGR